MVCFRLMVRPMTDRLSHFELDSAGGVFRPLSANGMMGGLEGKVLVDECAAGISDLGLWHACALLFEAGAFESSRMHWCLRRRFEGQSGDDGDGNEALRNFGLKNNCMQSYETDPVVTDRSCMIPPS